jgi:hypothetical protein
VPTRIFTITHWESPKTFNEDNWGFIVNYPGALGCTSFPRPFLAKPDYDQFPSRYRVSRVN